MDGVPEDQVDLPGRATAKFQPEDITRWTLVRTYQVMARRFYATFADVDLTPTHFGVLMQLARHPGTSQAALARRVFMTPQAMGELLITIQTRGLVTRAAGPAGKPTAVTLTTAGRAALHRAVPRVEALNRPEAFGLTAAESATLNTLLHKVRHALGDDS
ncbi:MAG: MarR family winged helix-turn-helix transcriptional regulator [Jatrophihabitans sp.]